MILAAVLVLLIVGSLLFHFLTPWYFTPIASNWGAIDDTIGITFWITGFVFVAINLFVAYCLVSNIASQCLYVPQPQLATLDIQNRS